MERNWKFRCLFGGLQGGMGGDRHWSICLWTSLDGLNLSFSGRCLDWWCHHFYRFSLQLVQRIYWMMACFLYLSTNAFVGRLKLPFLVKLFGKFIEGLWNNLFWPNSINEQPFSLSKDLLKLLSFIILRFISLSNYNYESILITFN